MIRELVLVTLPIVGCSDTVVSNPDAKYCFETDMGRYEIDSCNEFKLKEFREACNLSVYTGGKKVSVPRFCDENYCSSGYVKFCKDWND